MCQQTRVATVIEYWQKWMQTFPDIESLANAKLDDVHSVWAGLGYYRRATNLHLGAQKIIKDFNGNIPKNMEQLLTIPGIGSYTAGAIASMFEYTN